MGMKRNSVFVVSIFVVVLLFGSQINGHSYMSSPASRTNQAQSESGCRVDNPATYGNGGTNCPGPCDDSGGSKATQVAYTTQRGATIDLRWARNNHPGGFVRWAWAPTTSTTNAEFDAYAYRWECFEKGPFCAPSAPGATGDATTDTQTGCGTNLTVPAWVSDGAWTLQWAWFGGFAQLGDYYSCADYQVSGGIAYNSADITYGSPTYPVFAGGDYANPNLPKCQFRNTDRLHQCVEEDCNSPLYTLGVEQTGVPTLSNGGAINAIAAIYPTNVLPPPASSSAGVTSTSSSGSTPTPSPSTPLSSSSSSSSTSTVSLSSSSSGSNEVSCASDSDCGTGVCNVNGYCSSVKKNSGLGAGGTAALVLAFVFMVLVAIAVGFIIINKSEWPNWKGFNKISKK